MADDTRGAREPTLGVSAPPALQGIWQRSGPVGIGACVGVPSLGGRGNTLGFVFVAWALVRHLVFSNCHNFSALPCFVAPLRTWKQTPFFTH